MNVTRSLRLEGLRSEDFFVRSAMLRIFSDDKDPGTDATKAALAHIDRLGWEKSFEWPHRITDLAQDEESIRWLLDRLASAPDRASSDLEAFHLGRWFIEAPLNLLAEHREEFEELIRLIPPRPNESKHIPPPLQVIQDRLDFDKRSEKECLELLETIFEGCSGGEEFPHLEIQRAERVCQRLARDGGSRELREMVSRTLGIKWNEASDKEQWRAAINVQLAGLLRMTETASRLLELFEEDWDWLNESISSALVAMGDKESLTLILSEYPDLEWHARLYLTEMLQKVRIPELEGGLVSLLKKEDDGMNRSNIAQSLAIYGTPSSLAKARQVWEEFPDSPEYFPIIELLYASHSLLGNGYSIDMEEWREFLEKQMEGRVERMKILDGEDLFPASDDEDNFPTLPITNPDKVGRNDPCPCGSGKKYKKCCLP